LINEEKMDKKEAEKLVRKHSTKRLFDILVGKGIMIKEHVPLFLKSHSFYKREFCKEMVRTCPMATDLEGYSWCDDDDEKEIFYFKGGDGQVSCYAIQEVFRIIHNSFTGGDDYAILLQLPKDPYTRKVFSKEFIGAFIKKLKKTRDITAPEIMYFLRNYKKFYSDPKIKPFLEKNVGHNDKWKVSNAIEEFLTKSGEISHGWAVSDNRAWFWDEKKRPKDLYKYVHHISTKKK